VRARGGGASYTLTRICGELVDEARPLAFPSAAGPSRLLSGAATLFWPPRTGTSGAEIPTSAGGGLARAPLSLIAGRRSCGAYAADNNAPYMFGQLIGREHRIKHNPAFRFSC